MRRIALAAMIAAQSFASLLWVGAAYAETRCGWVVNPTPGNWWLTDSHGDWIMATQGSDRDPGMEHVPDITAHDFVKTNGYYGYGCGCMSGDFAQDPHGGKIVEKIASFTQKPLAVCRKDKSLKEPG